MVMLVCVTAFGGCVISCHIFLKNLDLDFLRSRSITRDEAVELVHGRTQEISLLMNDNYWYYFDLDTEENVAITYSEINDFAAYLYAETDKMPEPPPTEETESSKRNEKNSSDDYDPYHGTLDPATFDDSKLIDGNGFETFDLAAGRYYIHIHAVSGYLLNNANLRILFMITRRFPELSPGIETTVYSETDGDASDIEYWRFELPERSDVKFVVNKPDHMSVSVIFHYGQNNTSRDSLYLGRDEPWDNYTFPAGLVIVNIGCFVSQEDIPNSDATVVFTAAPAPDDETRDENEFISVKSTVGYGRLTRSCRRRDLGRVEYQE